MGLLDQAKQWMTPERALAFQGIGLGLSQLGAGQPVNLSPVYEALQQRKDAAQMRKVMEVPGLMDRFTPQQQAVLASMPESLATKIIMESAFAPEPEPVKGIEVDGQLINPITGEVMYAGQAETPDLPADVRTIMWQAEQLGYTPGTPEYIEYVRKQSEKQPLVSLNTGPNGLDYGDPGAGLVWARNPDNTVKLDERGAPIAIPFQGGKVWQDQQAASAEAAAAKDKAESGTGTKATAANVVIEDIGRLKRLVENAPWYNPATGFGASVLSGVGGSNAANAAQLAQTIKGNIGFDRLQQMREASPTGGALGQVAVQELEALQSVLGSLSQSQSEAQLMDNLERLNEIYTGILDTIYETGDPSALGLPSRGGAGASGDIPEGVDPEDWKFMSDEEKALFQ